MSAELRLTMPYPPSANEYWKPAPGLGLVPSRKALAYKKRVRALLAATTRPLRGQVVLSGTVYRPLRSGDLGNRLKVLEDALNGIAFLDDSQICAYRNFEFAPWTDKGNPRVELTLVGEAFASIEEAALSRKAKSDAAKKGRATKARNRRLKKLERLGLLKPATYRSAG